MAAYLTEPRLARQRPAHPASGPESSAAPSRETVSPEVCPDFSSGGEFSVGGEDELFLVDAAGDLAAEDSDLLVQAVQQTAVGAPGGVSAELFAAQIELVSAVCTDAGELVDQLATLRSAVTASGGHGLAAGLHPSAPFGDAVLNQAPRYEAIGEMLVGLLRTPTAAFQVHVGLPDEQVALTAYRGLRHRLAVVQALASCSPFWHGRDSGMASARWAVISSYPRGGVPPVVRSWEEYAALVDVTAAAAELTDYTQVWWDARLQPRLGTIEVRVMDAQPSLSTAAGLAALVQGLVRHCVEHPVALDVPSQVLAENSFRVARHGLETSVVDLDGTHRPVRALAVEAIRDARNALSADGLDRSLDAVEELLTGQPEYLRQRLLHARSGMDALVGDLVNRTETS